MTISVPAGDSVIIAGRPERVAAARAFAAALLGGQHPQRDTVVLLVSELVTNSVRHSGSARAGQTVTVTFTRVDGMVRVAVTDRAGTSVPVRRAGESGAEGAGGWAWCRPWPPGGVSIMWRAARPRPPGLRSRTAEWPWFRG